MTEKNPALKRNECLVSLSHEHHHGLVFCKRLKKAEHAKENIIKKFVNDFWVKSLAKHFETEEKLFLPVMKENALKTQFINEHLQIKKLISEIKSTDHNVQKMALQLANILNDHIRFEERIMFPEIEKIVDAEKLKKIGSELKETEISAHNFLPEFWKHENQQSN